MDILQKKEIVASRGNNNIFRPAPLITKGFVDGQNYYVAIELAPLEKGSAPVPPEIDKLIEWDEALYLRWIPKGYVEFYRVAVSYLGVVIAEAETTELEVKLDGSNLISLINGEEYTLELSSINISRELAANPINAYPVAVSLNKPVVSIYSSSSVEISWDALLIPFSSYSLYVTNDDEGTSFAVYNNLTDVVKIVGGLEVGVNYSVKIKAFSEEYVFESAFSPSAGVYLVPIPQNLAAKVTTVGFKEVILTWDPVSDIDGYDVYFKREGDLSYVKANSSLLVLETFTLKNLLAGDYLAYVVAVKGAFSSDQSNEVGFYVYSLAIKWEEFDNTAIVAKKSHKFKWSESGGVILRDTLGFEVEWKEQGNVIIS